MEVAVVLVWVLYAVVAVIFGVSMRRPIGALIAARRQHQNLQRELRALGTEDAVLALPPAQHLSSGLARVVDETRLVRLALAEPLQAVKAWHAADASPLLAQVDVGDGSDLDRCDELDMALVNARQAVWDWIATVERLPGEDQRQLEDLGLTTQLARELLAERSALQRTSRSPKRELERIERHFGPLLASLDRFEAALMQATKTSLYR